MRRVGSLAAAAAVAIAGFATALMITAPIASAWSWTGLPTGYNVSDSQYTTSDGGTCHRITVNGTYIGDNCASGFQAALDAYVNSTICTVNPAAGGSQCVTTTATTAAATTTSASTTPAPATTAAAPVAQPTQTQTVTTTAGVTTTVVVTSTLPTAPVAAFSSAAAGLTVTFTDASTSSSPLATITWEFGDGAGDEGSAVSHTYTAAGAYHVHELVTDSNGLTSQGAEKVVLVAGFDQLDVAPAKVTDAAASTLTAAATGFYRSKVAVSCGASAAAWRIEAPGNLGWTEVGSRAIHLWPAGCQALETGKGPVAEALLVMGHEAGHALGIRREKQADCYSLRYVARLGRRLGLKVAGVQRVAAAIVRSRWPSGCGK